MSKGSNRRPGRGYSEGYERIYGNRCIKHPRVKTDSGPCAICQYKEKKK